MELDETTIEEVIQQRESDAMIKFYAPWSSAAKEMKAEYNKLAQHYEPVYKLFFNSVFIL